MRPVIVAEHASARFGGEAMLPLQYFRHLRRRGVDVHLVVHERTRAELAALFPDDHDRIHYVPDTWLHRLLWWLGRPLPNRVRVFTTGWLLHLVTQLHQRPIVRRLVREHGVNVVHEPTPVSPRMPSLMYDVGAPVIIGPMNGGMSYPPAFRHMESRAERLAVGVGRRWADLLNWLLPGKRRAALLLVANARTRRALPSGLCPNVMELVENGVDTDQWTPGADRRAPAGGPVRFVFVGRLVDWKAVDLLFEAFAAAAARVPCRLDVIGDGPLRPALERQCHALGIAGLVTFHGFVPHAACRDHMRAAAALVLPSLYECGGAVVLEAMALGLPAIVTDWGGPADYVRDEWGIRVPPAGRDRLISGLAEAMVRIADSPEERAQLGARAQAVARDVYAWSAKVERVLTLYGAVLEASPGRPRASAAGEPLC
ncbi:MAG: glycosyltransferase family 4 protein [Actinobacteria bacterium]|nr:glycosyltransferase family 4 protein [Actinomycetota bacterium]